MTTDVVVQSGRERITERTRVWIETLVLLSGEPRNLKGMIAAITIECFLAVDFSRPPDSSQVILFDAPKIIFGLGICKSEYRARIGASKDVGNSIGVAIDGYVISKSFGNSFRIHRHSRQ